MTSLRRPLFLALALASGLPAGCRKPVFFPAEPLATAPGGPLLASYDTDGDGRADYFTRRNDDGRIHAIAYDRNGDGKPDETINLDALSFAQCRHLVIILDGVGYDLLKGFYDEGHLRLFHPPSRVIAPYPTLTDVCFEEFFGYLPVQGFEAEYYDRKAGRVVGGSWAYLRAENTPYNRLLHYRANMILDAVAYVLPWQVYGKEVNDSKRLFDRRRTQEVRAYYVSSAGVGTKRGAEGHRDCLRRLQQLVHQVVWETRGLVKVTLLSDHGHSYTPARRVGLEGHLEARGWRLTERLRGERDAAYIRFGLETYASFATKSPAALAADAVTCEGVELASYAENQAVVVLSPRGGRAVVRHKAGRFRYEPQTGDPLRLKPLLGKLKADKDGYHDADELLQATALHVYPAPLQRLWRAHFALVEHPGDVILSLADDYFSGSRTFSEFARVASTHGSLNYRNSTAFIMSTAGPLPPVLRSGEIPRHMRKLTGRDWPAGR
jgi:hypothetical protein